MEDYQKRVITEKAELDEKLESLINFTESPVRFAAVSKEEQDRLIEQRAIMKMYSDVLQERIEHFK
jgi:hypothetical protein